MTKALRISDYLCHIVNAIGMARPFKIICQERMKRINPSLKRLVADVYLTVGVMIP